VVAVGEQPLQKRKRFEQQEGRWNQAETSERKNRWYFCRLFWKDILKEGTMLYVHPLLGNGLIKQFLRRQIIGKQSIARLRNNSDNRRSVFNMVHAMPSAKQQNYKHVYINRCFQWGLCRRFIGDTEGCLQSVIAENLWVKDTKPSWEGVLRIQLSSANGRWRLYVL
jgi:hypothetical protein